jgi:hypothetical protein
MSARNYSLHRRCSGSDGCGLVVGKPSVTRLWKSCPLTRGRLRFRCCGAWISMTSRVTYFFNLAVKFVTTVTESLTCWETR